MCQVSLICTESFVPLGLGSAFVTDEAQKWIALTPTAAVRCCRNTLFTACVKSPQRGENILRLHGETIRTKQSHEGKELENVQGPLGLVCKIDFWILK